MTRDAEHTPSPQSVVVPVERWNDVVTPEIMTDDELEAAWRAPGEETGWFATMWQNKPHRLIYTLLGHIRATQEAAPAPSSLAGGDRKQFLCDVLCGVALDGNEPIGETADRILAALSPEAPARDGVDALRKVLIKARSELAIQYCYSAGRMGIAGCYPELAEKYGGSAIVQEIDAVLALTPRHEAPASHAFEASHSIQREGGCKVCGHDEASHEAPADLCKSCNGTGRELGSRFNRCLECWTEAPAEGAGEREEVARTLWISRGGLDRLFDEGATWKSGNGFRERRQCFIDADAVLALRARSSAPEARERDQPHCQLCGGPVEGWVCQACEASFEEVDGLLVLKSEAVPAAASADKLRIAVEALNRMVHLYESEQDADNVRRPDWLVQVLAALTAEV